MNKVFILFLFLFSFSFNANADYFTKEFLDEAIKTPNRKNEKEIIYDRTKLDGLRQYYGGLIINTNISQYYFEYKNYNILLITEKIDGIDYVCDYLILEKQYPETHLANGPVEINGDYFDWNITVVIKCSWRGNPFTDDISQAFRVNLHTKKIEPFIYKTIRLYDENSG